MGEVLTKPCVASLISLAFVADVERCVDFYKLLGMEIRGRLSNAGNGAR